MKCSLQQIADAVGARLLGDPRVAVSGVASILSASPDDLVFVEDEKHLPAAFESQAGAVIAGTFAASVKSTRPILISDHPKLAFARAARLLNGNSPGADAPLGTAHATAVIHPSAKVASSVRIEARAVIGERAQIGEGTTIGEGCAIGAGKKQSNSTPYFASAQKTLPRERMKV